MTRETREQFIKATIDRVAQYWNLATSQIKLMGYAQPNQTWGASSYLGVSLCYTAINDAASRKDGVRYKSVGSGVEVPDIPLWCIDESFMGCESLNRNGLALCHMFKESQERNVVCLIEQRGSTDIKIWLMPDLAKWREEERARDAERIAKFAAS